MISFSSSYPRIQKVLYSIFSLCVLVPLAYILVFPDAFAEQNDMRSDDFRVNVSALSPIKTAPSAGGETSFRVILGNISDILLVSIPLLAAIAVIMAGYLYIFSGGDSERVSKAKNLIKWNLLAIVVALLSYTLINIIASFFNNV